MKTHPDITARRAAMSLRPTRDIIATAFACAVAATTSARAEPLAPNLPPNAPSAVYQQTNAQLDAMLQQLGDELKKREPFDGIAIAENHCYPQASQLPASGQAIAFFKRFNISGVATEYPDKYNASFDGFVSNAQDKQAETDWIKYVVTGGLSEVCPTLNGISNDYLGKLEGQGDIDSARKLAKNNMVLLATDSNWKESDKFIDKNNRLIDKIKFESARLDEREAAKQINDAMDVGRVVIIRGARHLLQYAPTALRPQFASYGREIVTVAFDYTGHDVKDELALFTKEGHQITYPDIVMDWANRKVYVWQKPEVGAGPK